MSARRGAIASLRRDRPMAWAPRIVGLSAALLVLYAWTAGGLRVSEGLEGARWDALTRFAREEALPAPLRDAGRPGETLAGWTSRLWSEHGAHALLQTLALALVATALAALFGAALGFLSSRSLMTPDPLLSASSTRGGARPLGTRRFRVLVSALRLGLVLLRSIPEYVLAFLFLAIFGASAWPAVLALAIHNTGILGKLGSELVENQERAPLAALRGAGATRSQLALAALPGLALGRYLVFVFYRFETCVREASVLGMLGFVSLGYWIEDARSKHYYDELLYFVALGAGLVLLAELASLALRHLLDQRRR